jgi:phospholipid transport system substrate-binding protein
MKMRMGFLFLVLPLAFAMNASAMDVAAPAAPQTGSTAIQASATNGEAAQSMIEHLGKTAMDAIADKSMPDAKKKALFHQLLAQNFDMTTIGRFAAGKYWRQATPAQQQEYLRLYEEMVISVYTQRFNNYSGQTFSVTGNRMDESGDAVVSSQVTGSGSPVSVDWRVRNKGAGPKIIDVMVEGVSMAVTQRNDFASIVAQGGGTFDALISYLKNGGVSDVKDAKR